MATETTVDPHKLLQQHFGFTEFRDGQLEVIQALLAGQGAVAVFPTGAGKSLCYQLPGIVLDGVTLVVSPLLALMKDQVDALQARGISSARLDSSLSIDEYREVLRTARSGELKILYVAPERFNNERFRESLKGIKVSLFAVDEAHCVSEWGHNFRPDYLKLANYARACKAERILALTATATPKVMEDIVARFSLEKAVRTPFHRQNLKLHCEVVDRARAKMERLTEVLEQLNGGATIVYVTLQKTAMQVAEALSLAGFPARPYHAGLDSELRADTQDWFIESETGIVVATIAFGMGIDKSNIRAVFHFDPPKSLENYSQEIGRAGRDGETSVCHFFYHPSDRIPLENFVYGDTPTRESLVGLVTALFRDDQDLVINLNQLSTDHDVKPLVLRTLLTYLELDGFLEALTPVYSVYRFKPSASSKEILGAYSGENQRFLAEVLKCSVKKRTWFDIDLEKAMEKLACPRERVVGVLDTCGQDGWMEIKATGLRHRYRKLRRPESTEELGVQLSGKAEVRELAEIGRLEQVLSLATAPGCVPRRLALHFGEELEADCGECSGCRNPQQGEVVAVEEDFNVGQLPTELRDARTAARFLCAIPSPALRKLRLSKHSRFGALSHISFKRVLERLQPLY